VLQRVLVCVAACSSMCCSGLVAFTNESPHTNEFCYFDRNESCVMPRH